MRMWFSETLMGPSAKKAAKKLAGPKSPAKKPKGKNPLAAAIKLRGAAVKKVDSAHKALVKAETTLAKIDEKISALEAKAAAKAAKEAARVEAW